MKASLSGTRSIGHLAQLFGIETHVLRHWESEGLLSPLRNANGYREYEEADIVRVAAIIHQRKLGIPLPTIRVLLDANVERRREALEAHRAHLTDRIADLTVARDMTQHAIECPEHDVARCRTFRSYVEALDSHMTMTSAIDRGTAARIGDTEHSR